MITDCVGGPESIVVVSSSSRRWLASLSWTPLSVRSRRRLADMEDIEWLAPSSGAGTDSRTGSERAAETFNNMTNPVRTQRGDCTVMYTNLY